MRIAIIGTGISGLTAAYLLHNDQDIQVFEANDYIGGHTNTIEVTDGNRILPVDTGFIVFNEGNYPNLCRLFDALDVSSRDSDMSFSVHCEKTRFEYNGSDLNRLFSQRKNLLNLEFLGMLTNILRFHDQAPGILSNGLDDTTTVAEFSGSYNYSKKFVEYYLVPLGASLWSCPAEKFRQFPIKFVLEFLDNHCMLQVNGRPPWKTVTGGSREYVKSLVKEFRDIIHLNTPVKKVVRENESVALHFTGGMIQRFDEVILATHADTSLMLIEDGDKLETEVLRQFPYQDNETVLHMDTSLLPERERAWASWNYRIPESKSSHVAVTYNMNMLQGLDSTHTYCVSLNQTASINPEKIIKTIQYHHPVFQPGRDQAQSEHQQLIRRNRISYCGAYWGYGFHEDGVRSALSVCQAFNRELH